ncbi:MAG: NAD(P)/FAD-dependent oxidoreductase [Promethearchaeota archaeon]
MSISCDLTQENCYEVIVIGGGPAAVSAAIYTHRFALKTIMIGQEYGGAIGRTYLIENYPGFPAVSGYELMEAFQKHYEHFGIPFEYETVTGITKNENNTYTVSVSGGATYQACAVIITTGGKYRTLDIPGESEFHGRGVSYCATCDGPFFRDKNIIVVGGSDSAAVEALFLSKFGKKVNIVYRKAKIRAEPINIVRVDKEEKIEIIANTTLKRIIGTEKVESVEFHDGTIFPTDAVFIEIGQIPQSDVVKGLGVELNEKNEIIVDKHAVTNVPGIFAAGDVTDIREKQVLTAAGQAVIAAYSVRDYLEIHYNAE